MIELISAMPWIIFVRESHCTFWFCFYYNDSPSWVRCTSPTRVNYARIPHGFYFPFSGRCLFYHHGSGALHQQGWTMPVSAWVLFRLHCALYISPSWVRCTPPTRVEHARFLMGVNCLHWAFFDMTLGTWYVTPHRGTSSRASSSAGPWASALLDIRRVPIWSCWEL